MTIDIDFTHNSAVQCSVTLNPYKDITVGCTVPWYGLYLSLNIECFTILQYLGMVVGGESGASELK